MGSAIAGSPPSEAKGVVGREQKAGGGSMAWSKGTRIRRPRAWSVTGPYRELVRRLPRCAGSRRRLLALVERRGRGMGELGARRVTLARPARGGAARGPVAVLGGDRGGAVQRGRGAPLDPFQGFKEA